MGFPRKEYWSGLPFPSPGDFPDPGIEPVSLMSPALASGFSTTSTAWEAQHMDLGEHKHPLVFCAYNSLKTICLIYKTQA